MTETAADPVSEITALVASAMGTNYQPMLDVGKSPTNVPSARLQAALADQRFPFALANGFSSYTPWDEVVGILSQTGAVTFQARDEAGYSPTYTMIAEPKKADGLIVVECEVGYGHWTVSVVAAEQEIAERYMSAMSAMLPAPPPPPPPPADPFNIVPVDFWMQDPYSGYADSIRKKITTQSWEELQENYPAGLRDELAALMAKESPEGGKLVLLHGPPGSGKTRLVLTLMSEWREWCASSVVTDSDQFFGNATYLNSVVFNARSDRWLLVVIEDGDEFINVKGRESKGQAIARILNLCDGIVGQGVKLLVLMTTNVNVDELNPAVTRDGRCMANIHVGLFPLAEATEWLAAKGVEHEFSEEDYPEGVTLATMYRIAAEGGASVATED